MPVTQLKNNNAEWTKSDNESCELLNDYFKSVFTDEDDQELLFFNDFAKSFFLWMNRLNP